MDTRLLALITWGAPLRDGTPTPANGSRRRPPVAPLRALIIASMLATCASACTPPRAYEREALASPRMRLDAEGGETFLERGLSRAREEGHVGGGAGSAGGGGGGCGCN